MVRVGSLKAADELTGGCCRLVKGIHFIFVDGEKKGSSASFAVPLLPAGTNQGTRRVTVKSAEQPIGLQGGLHLHAR